MLKLIILKSFGVHIDPRKGASCVPVIRFRAPCHWFRCNTDGVVEGSHGVSQYLAIIMLLMWLASLHILVFIILYGDGCDSD